MPRHAIHLGAAWEPPAAGENVWTRSFGRPTGLAAGDRLVLVCEGCRATGDWAAAALNGRSLEWRDLASGALECDVTAAIADRNILVVPGEPGAAAISGPAARVAMPAAWGRLSLVVVSD